MVEAVKLALVLAFLQVLPGATPPSNRVIAFATGIAIIEPQGNLEHVVIEDPNGIIMSDSYCDAQSGKYDQIVQLGQQVRTAAQVSDKALMASLASYPLRVNTPTVGPNGNPVVRDTYVANKGALVQNYSTVITTSVRDQLRFVEVHDVFCKNGMSTLGGGVVWATVDHADGVLKISVINQ